MTVEDNKTVVMRLFEEALDKGNVGLVDSMFTEDCIFHRSDLTEPARGIPGIRSIVEKRVQLYRDFRTTIHQIIGEGDLVATRKTHTGIHRGQFPTPIGTFDVTGLSYRMDIASIFSVQKRQDRRNVGRAGRTRNSSFLGDNS
jgi:hypothetical protein